MVLIISNNTDTTTSLVINWMNHYQADWTRINDFDFELNNIGLSYKPDSGFTFSFADKTVSSADINRVWYRRFTATNPMQLNREAPLSRYVVEKINKYILEEKHALKHMLTNMLPQEQWLNHPATSDLNKLYQLEAARKVGLEIPPTIITNTKSELTQFIAEHGTAIVKPISNIQSLQIDDVSFVPFTTLVDEPFLDSLDDVFFPMLSQKLIKKKYEIRAFYLDGRYYSMAMFTQGNDKTKVDFRNYDDEHPSRRVPYKLPAYIEAQLSEFMKLVGLNSGSFDLIYTEDNRYCFLEVNPVGQFGMVSYPCNYYLEKKVAQYLSHEQSH